MRLTRARGESKEMAPDRSWGMVVNAA